MKYEVQGVYKNPRYRIINVDGNNYIIDVDRPFFILLFPFVYWLIPHNFYKVDNEKLIEKIKVPKESPNDSNKGFLSFVGIGGISLIISNLLNNIASYFNIHTSTNVKTGILLITLFMFVFFKIIF